MSAAFTPGPWYIDGIGLVCASTPERQLVVANVRTNGRANARLIAAAPKLYEALSGLVAVLPGSWDCLADDEVAAWKAAEAALAKARGEA